MIKNIINILDLQLTFEDLGPYNNEKTFNPCLHCTKSRRYNDEKEIINYDIVSVFDDILKLINKNNIEIKINNYEKDNIQNKLEINLEDDSKKNYKIMII
ncbi:hypothetical protein U3516DRAFT_789619 [Neocallimastix sp. 'constans']